MGSIEVFNSFGVSRVGGFAPFGVFGTDIVRVPPVGFEVTGVDISFHIHDEIGSGLILGSLDG